MRWLWRRDGENSSAGPAVPSGERTVPEHPWLWSFPALPRQPLCSRLCPALAPQAGPSGSRCPGHHRACHPRPDPPLPPPGPQVLGGPHRPPGTGTGTGTATGTGTGRTRPPLHHPRPPLPAPARLPAPPSFPRSLPRPPTGARTALTHSHTQRHTRRTHGPSRCSFKGAAAARGPPRLRPVRSRSPER